MPEGLRWGRCLSALVLAWIGLSVGLGQAPPTIREALQERHISLTTAALVEALHDRDGEVRGLAAAELAGEKVTEALPLIVRAAEEERDPKTKVNLASAATWMGSEDGVRMLKEACADRNSPPFLRVYAARGVFDRGDHGCFPALVEMIRSPDVDARMEAMSAASQIHSKTEEESKVVLELAVGALSDGDLRVRLQACEALRFLKNPAAEAALRRAMEREAEAVVRSQMRSTLEYLGKEQPGVEP